MAKRKTRASRTSTSLAIKRGRRYIPLPKVPLSKVMKMKKPPAIYAVKKRGGKVIDSRRL
jgi:hypothetical protein